jgi:hypothetical protein
MPAREPDIAGFPCIGRDELGRTPVFIDGLRCCCHDIHASILIRKRGYLMSRRPAAVVAALVLAAIGLGSSPAAASDQPVVPVGPRHYYSAMVNGKNADATIVMICVGPSATGRPAPGQTLRVSQIVATTIVPGPHLGYTGETARSINVALTNAGTTRPIAVFDAYGEQPLSTSLTLPCSGSATLAFLPAPNVGGRAATVNVRFVSWGNTPA